MIFDAARLLAAYISLQKSCGFFVCYGQLFWTYYMIVETRAKGEDMILQVLLLVVGFGLLTLGADIFVNASVSIAKLLRVPNIVIGLTIVTLGTGAPEIVVSISAALSGYGDMVVGNAVGSNLFNLLFVLGLLSVLKPVRIDFASIKKEHIIGTVAAMALLVMQVIFDELIPRWVPVGFLVIFLGYMGWSVRQALCHTEQARLREEMQRRDIKETKPHASLVKSVLLLVVGMALIVPGGQMAVDNAVGIATVLGMSERMIGLTILAVGTSLPEVVTSLVALKKGQADLAVGNVIGSSFFNIFFILGVSGSILPLHVYPSQILDLVFLVGVSLLFIPFAKTGGRLNRVEGGVFLLLYMGYFGGLVLMG